VNDKAGDRPESKELDSLANLEPESLSQDQLKYLFRICEDPPSEEIQIKAAELLSEIYMKRANSDKAFAKRVHVVFLRHLLKPSGEFGNPKCNWLASTHLTGENLADIPWESVSEISTAAEALYNLTDNGLDSEEVNIRVRDLVKYAGIEFAETECWEDLFKLISEVHVAENTMDADFYRLKNKVLLYERWRVGRLRKILSCFIGGVLLLVLLVSPTLFLMFENKHRITKGIEELTFFDAFYWSIITAGTVGYGDIVPFTTAGMVIVLLGVLAGLILSYLSPRST
jgi:hypothetical protein